jgi:diguanylate cyclase (GGDEF)-like protein/PAS domain S-box-containing protein
MCDSACRRQLAAERPVRKSTSFCQFPESPTILQDHIPPPVGHITHFTIVLKTPADIVMDRQRTLLTIDNCRWRNNRGNWFHLPASTQGPLQIWGKFLSEIMAGEDQINFQFLTENSADIICRFGLDRMFHYVSPSSFPVLGWTPEEMKAMPPLALIFPEDVPIVVAAIERNLSIGVIPTPTAARIRKKDGTFTWLEVTVRVARHSATGEATESVLVMRDISERKLLEEKLSALALIDGLTGLANRRAFDEVLEREWKRTLRESSQISLLLLDIDFFKQFNDRYGHQVGDDCLRTVASAITRVVRSTDVVARYGGEEIAIVLPSSDTTGAVETAEKVRAAIEALRITHEGNLETGGWVTASIGVATALARQGGTMRMPESLLLAADNALYKAKHEGRNRVATALLIAPAEASKI